MRGSLSRHERCSFVEPLEDKSIRPLPQIRHPSWSVEQQISPKTWPSATLEAFQQRNVRPTQKIVQFELCQRSNCLLRLSQSRHIQILTKWTRSLISMISGTSRATAASHVTDQVLREREVEPDHWDIHRQATRDRAIRQEIFLKTSRNYTQVTLNFI